MSNGKRAGWISGLTALMMMVAYTSNATAQEVPETAPVQEPAPAAAELTDDELRTFARAYVEVQELGLEHQAARVTASSAEEAEALDQRAQADMTAALESHGITVEEYAETVQALNDDPELQARFGSILETLPASDPSRE